MPLSRGIRWFVLRLEADRRHTRVPRESVRILVIIEYFIHSNEILIDVYSIDRIEILSFGFC